MPRAYSVDMTARVIGRVESGASRREAADHYEVSASTAVNWVKCFARPAVAPPSCAAGASRRWRSTGSSCLV
jgi:transposase